MRRENLTHSSAVAGDNDSRTHGFSSDTCGSGTICSVRRLSAGPVSNHRVGFKYRRPTHSTGTALPPYFLDDIGNPLLGLLGRKHELDAITKCLRTVANKLECHAIANTGSIADEEAAFGNQRNWRIRWASENGSGRSRVDFAWKRNLDLLSLENGN